MSAASVSARSSVISKNASVRLGDLKLLEKFETEWRREGRL